MIDTYATFEDLAQHATEGVDYRIVIKNRNSPYLIMAIHGGAIEPFTSQLAEAIAGEEHGLYLFEGLKPEHNGELHIGSEYFDEPQAKDLLRAADVAVAIHGYPDTEDEFVMVEGLNEKLAESIKEHLRGVDIAIRPMDSMFHPQSEMNICNRGTSRMGVEIEVSRKLADSLRDDAGLQRLFTNAIRHAIAAQGIL